MNEIPIAGQEIDGYRLVRPIGQGGFGTVWLCWSEASKSYHALKWVPGDAGGFEQEALIKFREISQRLRSPNLIAIEHINRLPSAFIYTLPLADGAGADDPADEAWNPQTLAEHIEARQSPWFSSIEILQIILPIINATAMLNNEGLVHRDIKPANILFFGGVPCLADMGLLSNDSVSLTRRGTPGFLAPSWFLESSGQPDMWGLATTLYSLLTGNNPDKMGRTAFLWPPDGKSSLSAPEQAQWQRLHAVIYRATHEKATERFRDFRTLASAVEGARIPARGKRKMVPALVAAGIVAAAVIAWFGLVKESPSKGALETPIILPAGYPKNLPANPTSPTDSVVDSSIPPPVVTIARARKKEFDDTAAAITQQLEERKASSTGELQSFHERAVVVTKKMRDYASKKPAISGIGKIIGDLNKSMSPSTDPDVSENVETPESDTALIEIRDELQSLAGNLPPTTLQDQMEDVNRLYKTLVDDGYSKTANAEEKFHFNDNIRPSLETEFERIFKVKPGIYPHDMTGMNLQLALVSPSWSSADKDTLSEIKVAVAKIKDHLTQK